MSDPFANGKPNRARLYRNPRQGKLCGVCAGVAEYFGTDVTIVRVATIVSAIIFSIPTLIAYIAGCFLLPERPEALYGNEQEKQFWQSVRSSPSGTFSRARRKFMDLEQRLRRMEALVTSREFDLNRELKRDR